MLDRFNARKRAVSGKWHVGEAYIKVRGRWLYLYRSIDDRGDAIEFLLSSTRDLYAAKHFLRQALTRHGRPYRIVIDGSQTNRQAIRACDAESRLQDRSATPQTPIVIRSSQYLNNRIEQDHRNIKRRVRPMLGFKSISTAAVIISGIELIHMMRKNQTYYANATNPSLAALLELLAA